MRQWTEPSETQRAEFQRWLDERPTHVRAVAQRFDPWTAYRLRTTGQVCQVIGFDEAACSCGEPEPPPDRVTVRIVAMHPLLGELTARSVFGIAPADLEPWPDDVPCPMFDEESFSCPRCGRTSHNPNDVRERYCGACHVFVEGP